MPTSSMCNPANGLAFPNEEGIQHVTSASNEAWFHLSGYINYQNSHVWPAFNLHEIMETPLLDQKVDVWCTLSQNWVIGLIFFEDTIISEHHCQLILYSSISLLNENNIACS
jgi:hypothetical protein